MAQKNKVTVVIPHYNGKKIYELAYSFVEKNKS